MKLVQFETREGGSATPGLLTERGVVDIGDAVPAGHSP
jgi:hypothetical protein